MDMSARDRIKKSLLDLMAEKPFEKISIVEITKRAKVSRTTYYQYFYEQREVLLEAIDDLVERLTEVFFLPGTPREVTAAGQDRIFENRAHIKAVLGCDIGAAEMEQRYREACRAFWEGLALHFSPNKKVDDQMFDFVLAGYWDILVEWVMGDCTILRDEVLETSLAVQERMMRMVEGE